MFKPKKKLIEANEQLRKKGENTYWRAIQGAAKGLIFGEHHHANYIGWWGEGKTKWEHQDNLLIVTERGELERKEKIIPKDRKL